MATIALPAFHITSTKKYTIECPHALHQELDAYRGFYKQTYGAEVAESDLIREILRAFLTQDEGFRAFKSGATRRSRGRNSNGHAAASSPESHGGQGTSDGTNRMVRP